MVDLIDKEFNYLNKFKSNGIVTPIGKHTKNFVEKLRFDNIRGKLTVSLTTLSKRGSSCTIDKYDLDDICTKFNKSIIQ